MDTNQHDFIGTIQKALGKSSSLIPSELFGMPPEDVDKRLNAYSNKSKVDQKALLELFIEQAELVHIKVTQVKDLSEASLSIRELVKNTEPEWGNKKSVIAWHHPLIEQLDLEKTLKKE